MAILKTSPILYCFNALLELYCLCSVSFLLWLTFPLHCYVQISEVLTSHTCKVDGSVVPKYDMPIYCGQAIWCGIVGPYQYDTSWSQGSSKHVTKIACKFNL